MSSSSSPSVSTSKKSTPSSDSEEKSNKSNNLWIFLSFLAPVLLAALLVTVHQTEPMDPAPLPLHQLFYPHNLFVPNRFPAFLQGSERVGLGELLAPEDILYQPESGLIYTGCYDGWVKTVAVNDSTEATVVSNFVNTGGRPLGLAFDADSQLLIADAYKGLLRASQDGTIELLTDEAEGVKFRITDGVDVADDGMIYFTDASYKYYLRDFILDILEGRPYGRFMCYNPSTKQTKVLARDLYFPNGVAVSPYQDFVIFCETPMRRCKKYHIKGDKEGTMEIFIDNLPGMPDNIRYDGNGHYWIALATGATMSWNLAQRYPLVRKGLAIMERYKGRPNMEQNGGFLVVDKEAKPIAHYYDLSLSLVSSGMKIGNHLYFGSIVYPYIARIDLSRFHTTTSTFEDE